MITAPSNAPEWAQAFARTIDQALNDAPWPFISRRLYLVAELTATLASQQPYKVARVSNGAGNRLLAMSNGSSFFYLDGTAV